MAGLLGMIFISVVGVNQDLCYYKTAVMLAEVGRTGQGFFIFPKFLSSNTRVMDMTGAYLPSGLVDASKEHHPELCCS